VEWEVIEDWFRRSRHHVELFHADPLGAAVMIDNLGIDPESTVAEVARNIGGGFVDHGWFRLLGSGHERMTLGLDVWNGVDSRLEPSRPGDLFVVGNDAVGGFFAIDAGGLGLRRGRVAYLAPDAMRWEDLEMGYPEFVRWLAEGDLAGFAEGTRWPGWEYDIRALSGDDGIFFAPPLWAQGPPVAGRDRTRVPMTELWTYAHVTMQQLERVPPGSPVRISALDRPAPAHGEQSPG
jgi:hypothetical protein